ncbi:MAG: HutD family protein [Oligoflexus sp.]|nr:HutD family protein [Oligoflexus sp.]
MTLNISHYTAADYHELPWKNETGSSTDLAIFPVGSTLVEPFHWRLSLSQINGKVPFSKFPGYDRNIIQLKGKTITLLHAKHGEKLLGPLEIYAFKGGWETEVRLIGSAEVFNLMVRTEKLRAKIERVDIKDKKPLAKKLSRYTLLWIHQGTVDWECHGEKRVLKERDTLVIDSSEVLEYTMKSKRALIFVSNIEDITRSEAKI